MRKKFLILLVLTFLCLFLTTGIIQVNAQSEGMIITESMSNESISLDNISGDYAIKITANSDIELDNVIISIGSNVDVTNLIEIDSGSTLTLTNVTFNCSSEIAIDILNSGILKVDTLKLEKVTTFTITNNSSCVDSLQLYNTPAVNVNLSSGYITVYENTQINGVVNINIGNTFDDSMIGKPLVKGRNTLASFYESKFYLANTPNLSDYSSYADFYTYLSTTNSYYMDYVGDIGDNLSVANDGYDVTNDNITYNIESGDLILTKFILLMSDTDNDEDYYICGRYATADKFIKGNSYAFTVLTYYIDNCVKNSKTFLLDNTTSIIGSSSNKVGKSTGTSKVTTNMSVSLEVYVNDTLESTKTINIIKNGSLSYFVDLEDNAFVSLSSTTGITTTYINTPRFVRILITISNTFSSGSVKLYLTEEEQGSIVSVSLENESKEYTSTDLSSYIKPYYELDSQKTYCDFTIKNSLNEVVTEVVNAGSYIICLINSDSTIEFENTELTFTVTQKKVALIFTNEFVYDGSPKSVSAEVVGKIQGDNVNAIFDNNSLTIPGNVDVDVALDNSNYCLDDEYKQTTLTISKATIDMTNVEFNSVSGVYSPNKVYKALAENVPNGVTVIYSNNEHTDVCDTEPYYYTAWAYFSVDEDFYNPIDVQSLSATITITKAIIDTSNIKFDKIEHVYDNTYITATITDELPEGVARVEYQNNSHKKAKTAAYIAVATFIIDDDYERNYEISPSSIKTEIKISKAYVDLSVIQFEDTTIEFDNKTHKIIATGWDATVLMVEHLSQPCRSIGEYDQSIKIRLIDTTNYYPLEEEQTLKTVKLYIVRATIISNYTLTSKTEFYSPNVEHELIAEGSCEVELDITYRYYLNNELMESKPIDSGEYIVYADFQVKGWDDNCYYPIESVSATLTISQVSISFKFTKLEGKTVTYDGNAHYLQVSNMPNNVTYTYNNNGKIDVGNYTVTLNISYDTRNYYIINYTELSAMLIISKANIDMSGVLFENKTCQYDGSDKSVVISGNLPEYVRIKDYTNNVRRDVGTSNAMVEFEVTSSNYNEVANKNCTLTIQPKPVTVSLKANQFTYDGTPKTIDVYVSGVLSGDNVEAVVLNNTNTNASVYYATVTGVNNSNYIVQGTTSLRYEILKADFDMSGISFGNVELVYDGKIYVPTLTGELPSGLIAKIVKPTILNVGTYLVYCDFELTNKNYNKPSRLEATVTVKPRPILITFSNYTNLVENGNEKSIGVQFIGVVETNFQDYEIIYSDTPITAGKYECQVVISNNNYEIIGSNKISFEIMTNVKTYKNGIFDMTFESEGFSVDTNVTVTDSKKDVKNTLNNIDVKQYKAFEIATGNNTNQEIAVTMSIKSFNISNLKYLKLFKIVDGNLKEIAFESENDTIKFTANTNDQIVILEELNNVDKNIAWIVLIVIMSIISLIAMVVISVKNIIIKFKKKA